MSPAVPNAEELRLQLDTWATWLDERTDRLLALEERCRVVGAPNDQADVAAAFVARKSIGERLGAVNAVSGKDREGAVSLMGQPLVDGFGAQVGVDLADAARLLDAILTAVGPRVDAAEQRQVADAELIVSIERDLRAAEQLSAVLGEQVNSVAQLRRGQTQRSDPRALAASAAQVLDSLRHSERERQRLLGALSSSAARLGALAEEEAAVRVLAATCRAKVLAAPLLAVPSVEALGPAPSQAGAGRPWAAIRVELEPYIARLDRLERALAQARLRFQTALDERDELRGLLQGFRDKAGVAGLGENPVIEPLYRRAAELLWSAPCDVAAARPLVDRYVADVNRLVALGGGQSFGGRQ